MQLGRVGCWGTAHIRRRSLPWGRACALGGAPIAPLHGAGGLPHHPVERSSLTRVVIGGTDCTAGIPSQPVLLG